MEMNQRDVQHRHDAKANVPARRRPEQADGIVGHDQERHLTANGERK